MNPKATFLILSSLVCAVFALTPNALKADFEILTQKAATFDGIVTGFSTDSTVPVFTSIISAANDLSSATEKITNELSGPSPAALTLSGADALDIFAIGTQGQLTIKHALMLLVEEKPLIIALLPLPGLSDFFLIPPLRSALVRLSDATFRIGPALLPFLPTDYDSSDMNVGANFDVDFAEVISAYNS